MHQVPGDTRGGSSSATSAGMLFHYVRSGIADTRPGLTDLDGRTLAEVGDDVAIADGPAEVLRWVDEQFARLLERRGREPAEVIGIGVGLPGPVEHETGSAVSPPIMPGWDGSCVPDRFGADYACPVYVDNDVNLMALGEYWTDWEGEVEDLLRHSATRRWGPGT
jgi:predicted NBD/HSP70 family sugar kinase